MMKNVFTIPLLLMSLALIGGCGDVISSPAPPPPAITISPSNAPSGTVGFSYNLALSASGGQTPYTWSVSTGALPSGLNLNANTGALSGVPASSGTSNFTVQVLDSSVPSRTGTKPFALVVNPQLSFSITSLPDGAVSVAYNATASISGGTAPCTWSVVSGSLPPGLTLNSATGAISGTPTTAGSYGLELKVTDSSTPTQTAKFFSGINIYPLLTITSTSLPDGVVGSAYSATLTASGGTGAYTWSVSSGSLPNGISLDPSTGIVSGTPVSAEQANFTVQVTDTANPPQTTALPLMLNVTAAGANDRLMKGSYVFLFQGFDSNGAVAIAGSMDADGEGSITGGVFDINRSGGPQENITIKSGTFAIDSDNRGSVTIQSVLGSQTFRVAMNASGTMAHFIAFDLAGPSEIRGNGIMKKCDAGSLLQRGWSGNYAFSFSGSTAAGGRSAILGSFSANAAGSVYAGLADSNSDGVVLHEALIDGTSRYSWAPNGRGTVKLNIGGLGDVSGAVYVVSGREFFFVRTDAPGSDLLSGEILQQSDNPFSTSVFTGPSVLHMEGKSPAGSTVGVGIIASESTFVLSGRFEASDGRNVTSAPVFGGSYAITSDVFGRGTMEFADDDLVFYMVDSATALVMDAAGGEVKTGMLERQTDDVSSTSFPTGQFVEGSESDANPGVAFESGVVSIAPGGNLSATVDLSVAGSTVFVGRVLSGTWSIAMKGRIAASGGSVYYVISPTRMIRADLQSGQANAKLVVVDQ